MRKRRKRLCALGLAALMGATVFFAGCGAAGAAESAAEESGAGAAGAEGETEPRAEKRIIYASFFPVYDLTRRIAGDKAEVRMIIEGGAEPHNFELHPREMIEIAKADLIVYNGAGMEGFIPDLMEATGDDGRFLDLSQGLTLLESGEGEAEEGARVNPHTWLSVRNAQVELDTLYRRFSAMDPGNEPYYRANLEAALEAFRLLDEKFSETLSQIEEDRRYFVVSHAAFNYLADDYGLKQVAVTGISPEDEPSAKQLKKIADFVTAHRISTIFFEGKATPKVAETLAENTRTKTATLYTMERLTEEEMELGYLTLMERNLEALAEAFRE